jgi:hypothetical protein
VSEINKQHISGFLCVQIALSEESIIQSDCCRIIYELNAEFSDFGSIVVSLSFGLCQVSWHRNDDILVLEAILCNDDLQLVEIRSHGLFGQKIELLALVVDIE